MRCSTPRGNGCASCRYGSMILFDCHLSRLFRPRRESRAARPRFAPRRERSTHRGVFFARPLFGAVVAVIVLHEVPNGIARHRWNADSSVEEQKTARAGAIGDVAGVTKGAVDNFQDRAPEFVNADRKVDD